MTAPGRTLPLAFGNFRPKAVVIGFAWKRAFNARSSRTDIRMLIDNYLADGAK
jgi:hypothetical protein